MWGGRYERALECGVKSREAHICRESVYKEHTVDEYMYKEEYVYREFMHKISTADDCMAKQMFQQFRLQMNLQTLYPHIRNCNGNCSTIWRRAKYKPPPQCPSKGDTSYKTTKEVFKQQTELFPHG